MRLDPKLVHSSIFKATDRYMWHGNQGVRSQIEMGHAAEHQSVWLKENGKGCLLYALGSAAAFITTIGIASTMAKPWKGLFVLGMLVAIFAASMFAYWRNRHQLTASELAALLPILDLTDVQRAYAETVVALERSGRSKEEIEEAMRALNALLDEDERLTKSRVAVSGDDETPDREALVQERERLVRRLAETQDSDAHSAFESSLSLLDERIAGYTGLAATLERIEAHQELLRQAILATRDAALHRSTVPSLPDVGTDALRSAVARAREQAQETERALAELRAV